MNVVPGGGSCCRRMDERANEGRNRRRDGLMDVLASSVVKGNSFNSIASR